MKGGGGARSGAGRKKREPTIAIQASQHDDPQAFLLGVMSSIGNDAKLRVDAAKALLPYLYQKKGEGGKKEERHGAAKKAAQGKFSAGAPPKLVVNNR